jgi:hypothetical protein
VPASIGNDQASRQRERYPCLCYWQAISRSKYRNAKYALLTLEPDGAERQQGDEQSSARAHWIFE